MEATGDKKMSLSKKYNIPQSTVQKMVNDGVISCSWPMYEKIYADFQSSITVGGKSITAIYYEVAEKNNVSEKTVRDVVNKLK